MEQQTTTAPMPQPQADEAAPKIWPWLTESRAYYLVGVMAVLAMYLRFAGGEG